ncbi:sugar-binding protein [Tengunoibacter tsumagoiensis]|uniref:Ig-like domain-containing protein n=1 Tax=Tengunoibacter tsumagoiensis TaxID=2014871 RepID=A0A401ZYR1_9CHLR|nr:sugar-binding protein [Tengunoibacter tsumagoiensis]GCE11977.1 hypothetical protein KTT_18360 [Tengunoibacter tsumagoiensis]
MFFHKSTANRSEKLILQHNMQVISVMTMIGLLTISLVGILHSSGVAHADAPTITVNKNVQFQTIEGMGTFGNKYPDYFGTPESGRWDDAFLTYYVGTLGASMNREAMEPGYEVTQGTYDASVMTTETDYVKALEAKASALGLPPVKIILSLWTPPAWMKQNGSLSNSNSQPNQLIDSDATRQAYADFVIHYINDFHRLSGVYPYAFSLQNEPELSLSYVSCYYTAPNLAKLLAVVGPALKQANIPTRLFYPEDVSNPGMLGNYLSSAEQNSAAQPYLTTFAVHGYSSNGVNPAADANTFWQGIYNSTAPYNLPVWMTETSGYDPTAWSAALQLGTDMYSALKYGHLSAWTWWLNSDSDDSKQGLLDNSLNPTSRSAVSEQYFHYIRPGAVMVDSTSTDANIQTVAFNDSSNHTMTVVLINSGTSDKTMSLSFQGQNIPSSFTAYRTSANEQVVNAGTVSGSVMLPASSITTLTGSFSGNDAQQAASILTQPQSQTVSAGQVVTLSVQAGGTPPFTYQWQRNGIDIPNAVGPQYTFSSTSADNGAQFTVTVKNGLGQATSQAATITIGAFNGATIAHASNTVTGSSDAIWNTAPSYTLSQSEGSPQYGFSGSFQSAWDATNLYLLVKLNDANYTSDSDAIEVYVDGNNDKSTSYDSTDYQIALDQSTYSMKIYQNGTQTNPPVFPSYGQADGTGTYSQFIAIPWSDLGQTPAANGLVGFDVAIIQGSTSSKTFWHASSNDDWHNPSLFGTGQLSSDNGGGTGSTPTPGPTPTPPPTATPTPGTTPTPTPTPGGGGTLPSPWQNQDIGSVGSTGSSSYANSTFAVNGSGSDIGGTTDAFQYAYQSLNGDGTIVARVASMSYPNGYARAGVMIRESLQADSAFAYVALTACCGSVTEARTSTGGSSSWNPLNTGSVPGWVKLVRSGNTFTSYTSTNGTGWTLVDTQTISMANTVDIGLAVVSYNNTLLENSTFDNVSVTHP